MLYMITSNAVVLTKSVLSPPSCGSTLYSHATALVSSVSVFITNSGRVYDWWGESIINQGVKEQMRDKLDLTFQSCNGRVITGLLAFIASGVISFLLFFFAAILSKLLPPFQNQILCAIQNDRYN